MDFQTLAASLPSEQTLDIQKIQGCCGFEYIVGRLWNFSFYEAYVEINQTQLNFGGADHCCRLFQGVGKEIKECAIMREFYLFAL